MFENRNNQDSHIRPCVRERDRWWTFKGGLGKDRREILARRMKVVSCHKICFYSWIQYMWSSFCFIKYVNPSTGLIGMGMLCCIFGVSLTRCLCRRASHGPYQHRSAGGTRACQTGSDQRSAAPALRQSCQSGGSTCPWTHPPGWTGLRKRNQEKWTGESRVSLWPLYCAYKYLH